MKKLLVFLVAMMMVSGSSAMAQSFNYQGTGLDPIDIAGGANVSLFVPDSGYITDLDISIELAAYGGEEGSSTWWDDLTIITYHANKWVPLKMSMAINTYGLFNVTFDDDATSSLLDARGVGDALGAIQPDGLLSNYNGLDIYGCWDLFFLDSSDLLNSANFLDSTGFFEDSRLVSWGISGDIISGGIETTPVPEPTTLLLLSSGLVGLAGFGRRKLFNK